MRKCYSIDDVSSILNVSKSKVYNLILDNKIPNIKLGGRYIVPIAEFDRWFNASIEGGVK